MKIAQTSVQLFTVRHCMESERALASTLHKIKKIGYVAVEPVILDYPEEALARIAREEGLVLSSALYPGDKILYEPQAVIDGLKSVACDYGVVGSPGSFALDSINALKAYADKLESVGSLFSEHGLRLVYHNHDREFQRIAGELILDYVYAHTGPDHLLAEIDTQWVQYGGQNPVAWCRKLKGRLPLLHLRDYHIVGKREVACTAVGSGNIDFPPIVRAAEASGCHWFIVEIDLGEEPPFDALQESFDYIREKLID